MHSKLVLFPASVSLMRFHLSPPQKKTLRKPVTPSGAPLRFSGCRLGNALTSPRPELKKNPGSLSWYRTPPKKLWGLKTIRTISAGKIKGLVLVVVVFYYCLRTAFHPRHTPPPLALLPAVWPSPGGRRDQVGEICKRFFCTYFSSKSNSKLTRFPSFQSAIS